MHQQELITAEWRRFESLRGCLSGYLKKSEEEFSRLIQALIAYGEMEEQVRKATGRACEVDGDSRIDQTVAIRQSMLHGCEVFRRFLGQIDDVSQHLHSAVQETDALVGLSKDLQKSLEPFTYIAIQMRLEGARLVPDDKATISMFHKDMSRVLSSLTETRESQRTTLLAVRDKFSAARQSVEQVSASFAVRATESENRIRLNLDKLSEIPPTMLEAQDRVASLQEAVASGIRDEVRILQSHDAIRQRIEHILNSLEGARSIDDIEPARVLTMQRQQARAVRQAIASTGSSIDEVLKSVIGSATDIAAESQKMSFGHEGVERFEKAVDQLASLNTEVSELLAEQIEIGRFVLIQLEPIQELLSTSSRELEAQAHAMKILALNVSVGAGNMPESKVIDVLGARTSEQAEAVLHLATALNEQFAQVGAQLRTEIATSKADVELACASRSGLRAQRPDAAMRASRRIGNDEVASLSRKSQELQRETEALVQTLTFVAEGSELLEQLDATLEVLIGLYPEPEQPFDMHALTDGYTMREQHQVHASISGVEISASYARLSEAVEGDDYGDNVELF